MFDPPDLPALVRQLNSLRKAMTSGVLVVDYPERGRITYRSFAEMREQEKFLLRNIQVIEGTVPPAPRRSVVIRSNKGW